MQLSLVCCLKTDAAAQYQTKQEIGVQYNDDADYHDDDDDDDNDDDDD